MLKNQVINLFNTFINIHHHITNDFSTKIRLKILSSFLVYTTILFNILTAYNSYNKFLIYK